MRKIFSSLLLVLVAAAPMFGLAAPTAQAATINTAIRGQSALTVYWYANDGKRYTFPNANTFFTWFPSFDSVINLTDAELANIPLGNQNVTYRPGAKLVKIVSDSKVYAVSKGGVLRHVSSESLAIQLYGQDWNLNVHDVPVEFFTNYTVGSPIYSTSDYFVGNEYNSVANPADSFRTIVNGSQTGSLNLTADRTAINPGQAVNLTSSVPAGYANGYVRIYDLRNGTQIASCSTYSYASSCNQTVYPQRINTGDTQVQYEVRLLDVNGNRISSAFGPVIFFSNTTGSSSTFTGTRFITTVSRTTANNGDSVTLTAQLTNQNGLTSNYRIEIQDPRSNTALHNCWNTSYCQISTNISLPSGQSSVNFRARLFDAGGALIADEIFPLISQSNTGTGTLTFTSDRTNITSGQAVYLSATYNTNLPSGGRIELKEVRTNNIVKTCYDSSSCSVTVYPTQASGYTSTQYVANVLNSSGSLLVSMNSSVIYFNGTGSQTGSLSLTADRTSITTGQSVTLYASYTGSLPSGGRLEIKRDRTNETVTTCYNTSCSITVYPRADAGLTIDQYYVTVMNSSGGSVIGTQYGPVINISGTTSGSYENDGTNYINGLTLQADRTSINRGDSVTLTANAHNIGNWSYMGNRIEIRDVRNSYNVVKTCNDQSWCTISLPVYGTDGIAQYEARIWDRLNRLVLTQNGPVIYVSGSTTNGGNTNTGAASVTLESNRTSITSGETVTLTARSFNAAYDTRLEIYDNRTGNLAGSCSNTSVCPISVTVSRRNSDETNAQFYTVLKNVNGAEIARQFGPVIAFTGTGSTGSTGSGSTLAGTTDIYVSPSSNLRPNNTVYVTASILNPSTAVQNMIIRVYTESNGLLGTCNGVTVCSLPFNIGPSGVNTRTYAQFSATDRSNTIETSRINLIAN